MSIETNAGAGVSRNLAAERCPKCGVKMRFGDEPCPRCAGRGDLIIERPAIWFVR
ncbi:hypothetical protein [Nocardia arthritidis]|uniref:Uncharacterized protein n=1 Tax=Nocardia arthritidis TaxID=228602 RepID=A0A6G9YUF4_9NOCA|nr:hypothetical protein [Nocardia arthritidis]QIS16731.1 hypothetical protein F5544_44640 [Nocardia arthritidis]